MTLEMPMPRRERRSENLPTRSYSRFPNAEGITFSSGRGDRRNRIMVGSVGFHNVTMEEAVERILSLVGKADRPCHVCTGNLDHLAMLDKDVEFRKIYESASLVLADGMPVIWLSRLKARRGEKPLQVRVAGSDLFWELGKVSARTGLKIFFMGGMPGSADKAAAVLQDRYPGVQICGTYCPPFETFETPEEQDRIAEKIRAAAPDVLLVGLGAPKQEKWIVANKHRLGVPVSIGVGGSFEMAAGMFRRAPEWIQRAGFEWAYRMLQDPKRLCRRYLGRDLPFLMELVGQTVQARLQGSDKVRPAQ